MKIAIYGTGAVGGYFGGRLAQTDHDLIFIARGAHLAAIHENGLHITSDKDTFIARPALATDNPAEAGQVDVIVLATKAWQVADAARSMQPMLGTDTLILPLLNGIEASQMLAQTIDEKHILGGFCRVLSNVTAPGRIEQGGTSPFVAIGERSGQASARIQYLAGLFESAGIAVQMPDNILAAMWQKLLFIASVGGVGTVTRMPAGVIRTLPETRTLLQDAMQEIADVARAKGILISANSIEQGLQRLDALPETATVSMQRDIMAGRPSELDAQNGAVVRAGLAVNVPTPMHRFLYHALLPMEKQARGEL
ncbi:MAG: 2-dehydropantoate 2-reductase [Aggregatilineales bacterium]